MECKKDVNSRNTYRNNFKCLFLKYTIEHDIKKISIIIIVSYSI